MYLYGLQTGTVVQFVPRRGMLYIEREAGAHEIMPGDWVIDTDSPGILRLRPDLETLRDGEGRKVYQTFAGQLWYRLVERA